MFAPHVIYSQALWGKKGHLQSAGTSLSLPSIRHSQSPALCHNSYGGPRRHGASLASCFPRVPSTEQSGPLHLRRCARPPSLRQVRTLETKKQPNICGAQFACWVVRLLSLRSRGRAEFLLLCVGDRTWLLCSTNPG